ncbi:MAG: lipopolysaccharide biosynthesis protein [Chitinophagaceae bacterium]
MSQIRRQSIISSVVVYTGFVLGFLNTYLFTREGGFTKAEYGLTGIFIAIAAMMYAIANMGLPSYIYKFYPYYKDNLPNKKNDMLSWSLLLSIAGFCLVVLGGLIFKDLIIRKFGTNSPELVKYFYWIFPFGLGLTIFSILEAYAWQLHKSVLTNFLKEVQFRVFTTLLIILSFAGIIHGFDLFIKLYSLTYLAIAILLFAYLAFSKQIHFQFSISKVTRKFSKQILRLLTFIYSGGLVFTLASVFDSILIASVLPQGMALAGIYTLAQNIGSLIQAPQRGIIASSIPSLAAAWKNKDMGRISRIYTRSSVNQLIFSVGMFALIWLNFSDGVFSFHLQSGYLDAKWVFFYIGMMRIIDMGTGLNAQIIATSTFWRFDFITGVVLLIITLPLNYILTKYYYGVMGPAISNLISFSLYNAIRYFFLIKRFKMQPFTIKTIYTIVLGVSAYYIAYLLFKNQIGIVWIVARSACFIVLYGIGTLLLKLSPDIQPVWYTILKRLGIKKGE